MGRKIEDLTGKRFGRLVILELTNKRTSGGSTIWKCQCDCGNLCEASSQNLKGGSKQSCGCLSREQKYKRIRSTAVKNGRKNYNQSQQVENTKLDSISSRVHVGRNNTSGVTGVSWNKKAQKWVSYIKLRGRSIYLGSFHNKQDAINARKAAEEKYFKPILEKYGEDV